MSEETLIYGVGGAGRELACSLSLDKNPETSWKVGGFIDDTAELWGKSINDIPVLGGFEYLKNYSGNLAVTIFDYPVIRKDLISRIKKNDRIKFPVLISSTAIVYPFVEWGEGCIIKNLSIISCNTKFGDFVLVNGATIIGHDTIVGDFTTIFSGIQISGGVSIGSGCLIGSNATILPKVKIGDGAIVGGGALVNKDIPPKVVAGGVPAKVIREIK
jgi:sugar O-acyltransferase (sialic acid O-acetyltransferase NeuD family)